MNYLNKIVELSNTEDEDINDYIEKFNNRFGDNSIFIYVTHQEDENLWGEIVGLGIPFPYHFEVKDICNIEEN